MCASLACGRTPAEVARSRAVRARCSSRVHSRATWRSMCRFRSRLMCSISFPPRRRESLTRAISFDFEESDSDNKPQLPNKLNLPPNALQNLARGLKNDARSDVPIDLLSAVADLPMTDDVADFQTRASGLKHWRDALRKGTLPRHSKIEFPEEPFRQKFLDSMSKIEMPRFTRRYPMLTDSVLRQMLEYTREFELELLKKQEQAFKDQQKQKQEKQEKNEEQTQQCDEGNESQESSDCNNASQSDKDSNCQDGSEGGESAEGQEGSEGGQSSLQDQLGKTQQQQSQGSSSSNNGQDKDEKGQDGEGESRDKGGAGDEDELSKAAAELAEEIAEKFEKEMAPIVDSIEAAMEHFGGDLQKLLDGDNGWDLSQGLWQKSGWQEFSQLRKKLEKLRELRELVRSLGRGGGKGPLRKAPEELYATKKPPGVIRSPLVPEQVEGLYKSGSLTQMLPVEAGLLAMGWPRSRKGSDSSAASVGSSESSLSTVAEDDSSSTDDETVEARGSHPARLLFKARLAEKSLMSYQRAGWLDDEPARLTGRMEMRPAGELGPIIVCLDTSGSMYGGREVVAKALVLECMRGAQTQMRKCYVYAFSGPGDVRALDLSEPQQGLEKLLEFLECSFNGGTDVDRPLELALERLKTNEWESADLLMVTDGEIPRPSRSLIDDVKRLHEEQGLEVHGLLVGNSITDPMEELCTKTHLFQSWHAVGGKDYW